MHVFSAQGRGNLCQDHAGSVERLAVERAMSSAMLEWIDAETPHAKVLREEQVITPAEIAQIEDEADVHAAIERVETFAARWKREALEQPLIVVETA